MLYHTYYQSEGVTAKYRRAFSFYVGYNIGFWLNKIREKYDKKARKFIPLFLIGSLLAEDNGWYMSVGYQIGGTQQFINNKQLLENQNIINSITQSAINIAGPTTRPYHFKLSKRHWRFRLWRE